MLASFSASCLRLNLPEVFLPALRRPESSEMPVFPAWRFHFPSRLCLSFHLLLIQSGFQVLPECSWLPLGLLPLPCLRFLHPGLLQEFPLTVARCFLFPGALSSACRLMAFGCFQACPALCSPDLPLRWLRCCSLCL